MKRSLISLVVGLLIGAATVYFLFPRVETKIHIQKETETQTRTVTRRVVLPDGTRTTERVTDTIQRENERTETESKVAQAQWRVNVHAKASLQNLVPQYGASVERRILGPVWVGVGAYQDGTANVSVGWEF